MYTLITADDETDKLEALRDLFDWAAYGIQIVGEASDGQEALDLLLRLRPDLCIIDIRMPKLSGLDAIRNASAQGVKTKFIVFSGYDDFDYARQAVQLQIVEYLLKPCRCEEVVQAVQKAITLVREEQQQEALQTQYQFLCAQNQERAKEQFLQELLAGQKAADTAQPRCLQTFGLEPLLSCYAVCCLDFVGQQAEDSPPAQAFLAAAKKAVCKMAHSEAVLWKERVVLLLFLDPITEKFTSFQNLLFHLLESAGSDCHTPCVIGVSDLKSSSGALHEAYTEAEKAAGLAAFDEIHGIRYYAELQNSNKKTADTGKREQEVIDAVLNRAEKLPSAVDHFFSCCTLRSPASKQVVQETASTLVCSIFKTCLEHNMVFNLFSKMLSDTIETISGASTMREIKDAVLCFARSVSQSFTGNKQISAFASAAVAYIRKNYAQKITLKQTAEDLHISPAYLSMLFKQQTGMNFIEYLNRYRIQKAKEYLHNVDSKIYEVADKIGIQDEKYFHSLFKRYTGQTATQYRDSLLCSRTGTPAVPEEFSARL
ncbi:MULTISPECIES: response regulator transcription factor [Caproicibacterium]|uniref:Stage 0 sporulation protein A homolog n=1 Tax=Caproicibacterium argilliputei TaxID=3030016 RepID=A0AA97DCY0_9FIRM|nr:response regulator [Caproicibacterium argilliputei]WOC33205.1 response regulator [Caproicibacterium argilliputei]